MNISTTTANPLTVTADLLVLGVGDDLAGLDGHGLPTDLDLAAWARTMGFTGSAGAALTLPGRGTAAHAVALVGTGDGSAAAMAKAAARAGRAARDLGARRVAVSLASDAASTIEHLAAGNYAYDRYKKEGDRKPAIDALTWIGEATIPAATAIRARWQAAARDIVNAPPADLYPGSLADWATAELGALAHTTVEVWDEHRLAAEGCVGTLAVGQGSTRPPRMIHVAYRPPGARGHVALVGKGITFDSGGLSLKPSAGMQTMRCDMGGAATMLAAAGAAAEQGLPLAIDVFVAAAENMVDGGSYKLGDILTYANGVTVEIHNTDAEGRLVLADALIHACRVPGVTHLVDAATLTGACVVAVGNDFTGLFTASDELAAELHAAANEAGEGVWRLPLHADYKSLLKADWAQIKNVGGPSAGATTAALFLQYFVSGPAWAHLDIAGSSFHDKGGNRYAAGATGEPVRTLVSWLEARARA